MQGHATVPKEMGIFPEQTYRMYPDVCKPISEGVYESRLTSAAGCEHQKLILGQGVDVALKPAGISYVQVTHKGRSQASPEEAMRIGQIYQSLLGQSWIDRDGNAKPIRHGDIVIVAPYNAQIKELKKVLGKDARVGTVDKFQGQEAAVAISVDFVKF